MADPQPGDLGDHRPPARRLRVAGTAAHPGADGAHHLVGDRAQAVGPLVGVMRSSPLRAEEHDRVAGAHVGAGAAVDHQLVHRDDADHRAPGAADQHLLPASGSERNTPSA